MKEALKNALVLIARQPQIRTVEIADLIDCDTDQVEPMLKPYIEAHHISLIPVTAPNGRPANGFILTDAYRKTPEGREIIAAAFPVEPDDADEQHTAPVEPQMQEAPSIAPVAQAASEIAAGDQDTELSKVELAIRHIKQNGSANGNQLRELLKLQSHQYPLAYLKSAVYSGRLRLDGGSYYIGDGTPATPRLKKSKARLAPSMKPTPAPAPKKSEEPAVAPTQQEIRVLKPIAAPVIRCAVWSDGQIDIQRNGELICSLQRDEASELAKFIAEHRIAA